MNTFDIALDLDKGMTRQPQVVRVRQADHDGTTIRATVYDHGEPLASTPDACSFLMKLPDGAHYYRKYATWVDGAAIVTIDEQQAASAAGRTMLAYFMVAIGANVYSTGSFAVIVEPDAVGDAELPESYDSAIQEAIDALDEAVEQLPSTVEDVLADHPEWTTTVQDGSITDAKLVQTGGVLDRVLRLGENFEVINETFIRGGIATDGSINSETYRIVTQDILQYDIDVLLRCVDDNYQYKYVIYDENDSVLFSSTYGQSQQFIAAGDRFRIAIAKVSEAAVPADVSVFRTKVMKETTSYMDYLKVMSFDNDGILDTYIKQRFSYRYYNSSVGKFDYSGYVSIAEPLIYPFDITVTNANNTLYYFNVKCWSDASAVAANYVSTSGWVDGSYTIRKNTYFTLEYTRKAASTPLPTPSEVTALVSFSPNGQTSQIIHDAIECKIVETSGYYNAFGSISDANSTNREVYTQLLPISTGIAYEFSLKYTQARVLWAAYALFDKDRKFIAREALFNVASKEERGVVATNNESAAYVSLTYRTYGESTVQLTCSGLGRMVSSGVDALIKRDVISDHAINPNINSINHRGFNTVAPENTLPAYRLSKRNGYKMVECDVSFTSDGVAVLLHDYTINRTARNADGTALTDVIPISSITYEQALSYDFGVWKGQEWAGTKIPTLAEFVTLCRNIGLHPYIEIKEAGLTQENVYAIVDIVRNCGMAQKVTWISFSSDALEFVLTKNPKARVGLLVNSIDSAAITMAQSLMSDTNDVFIDSSSYTSAEIELCQNADMPLEVWNFATMDAIAGLPTYVSGITSDIYVASYVLYQSNIND